MFEYRIQRGWEKYKRDYGLVRLAIYTCGFNSFLFFLSGVMFGSFMPLALYPVAISFFFFFFRKQIAKCNDTWKFIFNTIPITMVIILNYYVVGEFDRMAEGLTRVDPFMNSIDLYLFNIPVAIWIDQLTSSLGVFKTYLYDWMQISYLTYFPLPFYGGILYFRNLPKERRYDLYKYSSSVLVFYNINYLFYLIVPVTGPQFHLKEMFTTPLPLSGLGHSLHNLVFEGQPTFIDCFPSGHTGIAVLVTLWLFEIKHPHRYFSMFIMFSIVAATMALRYHYLIDVIGGFALAYLCFLFGKTNFNLNNSRP